MATPRSVSAASGTTPTRALVVGSAALSAIVANPIVGRYVATTSPRLLAGSGLTAGLAGGPLLTGFGVQQTGFSIAMVLTAIVLTVFGGACLARMPPRVSAVKEERF